MTKQERYERAYETAMSMVKWDEVPVVTALKEAAQEWGIGFVDGTKPEFMKWAQERYEAQAKAGG